MPALTGSGSEEYDESNVRSDRAALADEIRLSAQTDPESADY
jgi:hypothetical protein